MLDTEKLLKIGQNLHEARQIALVFNRTAANEQTLAGNLISDIMIESIRVITEEKNRLERLFNMINAKEPITTP